VVLCRVASCIEVATFETSVCNAEDKSDPAECGPRLRFEEKTVGNTNRYRRNDQV
jgi:hypothetical protein